MRIQPQHILRLGLNDKVKSQTQIVHIYLFYSYGSKNRKKAGTGIKIEAKYWDNKKQIVKQGYPEYEIHVQKILDYKKQIEVCKLKLRKGEMLPSTALNTVLENKEIKDQTLVDWLDNSDKATQVKKFKGIISAIETTIENKVNIPLKAVLDKKTGKVIQKPKEMPKELEEIINKRKRYRDLAN